MNTSFFKGILDFLATNSPNIQLDLLSSGKRIIVNSLVGTIGLDESYEFKVFVGPKKSKRFGSRMEGYSTFRKKITILSPLS